MMKHVCTLYIYLQTTYGYLADLTFFFSQINIHLHLKIWKISRLSLRFNKWFFKNKTIYVDMADSFIPTKCILPTWHVCTTLMHDAPGINEHSKSCCNHQKSLALHENGTFLFHELRKSIPIQITWCCNLPISSFYLPSNRLLSENTCILAKFYVGDWKCTLHSTVLLAKNR